MTSFTFVDAGFVTAVAGVEAHTGARTVRLQLRRQRSEKVCREVFTGNEVRISKGSGGEGY